jgi:hypothetical protein
MTTSVLSMVPLRRAWRDRAIQSGVDSGVVAAGPMIPRLSTLASWARHAVDDVSDRLAK